MFKGFFNLIKEIKDCVRLFSAASAKARRIVFYSESDIYYQYYEGIINELLRADNDIEIAYITSDINDSIFARAAKISESRKNPGSGIKTFYINYLLAFIMVYLDSKVFLMTMPDLDNFYIKRSINPVHYIYVFHSAGSTHLQYRKNAFDHYDAVLCTGSHQKNELRRSEEIYGLKSKTLVECGYHRIEKIFSDHIEFERMQSVSGGDAAGRKISVMIAPTWTDGNILDSAVFDMIESLRNAPDINAVIRPHPEFIKRFPGAVARIARYIETISNISLELDMLKDENLHKADVLITDWSGIYLEYTFGTSRPALFIDTPCRVDNKEYEKLELEPVELLLRPLCGKIIKPGEVRSLLLSSIEELMLRRNEYRTEFERLRKIYLYNFMNSSCEASKYIIKRMSDGGGCDI